VVFHARSATMGELLDAVAAAIDAPDALRAGVGHLLDRLCGREDPPRLLVILVDASAEAGNAQLRRVDRNGAD
jgi:hypothetical protein